MQWRKRFYEALYRLSQYPLPFDIVFEHGKVNQVTNPASEPFWERVRNDPTGDETGEPIMTPLESEDFARELEIVEEELARNNLRRPEAIEQVEALEDEKDDAIGKGRGARCQNQKTSSQRPGPAAPAISLDPGPGMYRNCLHDPV